MSTRNRTHGLVCLAAACAFFALAAAAPVAAQTPTPPPTPTPTLIETADGAFVVTPTITFGEVGIVFALLLVAALLLVRCSLEVAAWFRQ